jgi:rod shape-determining protein MreC
MKYVIICIILLILSFLQITFPLTFAFTKLVGPAQQNTSYSAESIKNFFMFFTQMQEVARDYEDLYLEYQSLQNENIKLKFLKNENDELRKQLKVVNSEEILKNKRYVYALTYPNPADRSGTTVLMNVGTVSGVHKGDVAIKDNNIVGIVKNSTSGRSVLELITSPNVKIPAYNFSSQYKSEGIVSGKYGTSITLENILPSEVVREGDVLMTSAREISIPPNLIIGKIVKIEGGPSSTVRTAFVESLLDLKNLQRVYILVE